MHKKLLYIILFLWCGAIFSQTEIYYFKDSDNVFSIETIENAEFSLLNKTILERHSNTTYWFKIPASKINVKYIFRIPYDRIHTANAFQNGKKIKKLKNQRYVSYKISRDDDVYIQVKPTLHCYIPIDLNTEEKSILKEKNQLLLNSFYYGFAFLVIVYNLFYFFLFKDDAFLYYSLLLMSITFGLFIMDGMLNFLNIPDFIDDFLMTLNYVILGYVSSKFANSYLFLDMFYPKLKKFSYSVGVCIIISAILYLVFKNYYYLLVLNILVFSLLVIYWCSAVLLFKRNIYTKILVFAYVIFLISGIDFFVLKFLGVSVIDTNSTNIKVGAFLEMIILSIAVLYRMKTLKEDNHFMRNEIISYSIEIKNLSEEISEEKQNALEKLETILSVREDEIFQLIVEGKSNKEIGNQLNISVNTVKFHIKNIYEKLNIKSRKEVLEIAKSQY
ncbi:hypothetical protein FDT66_03835 [Polaribacter aestuariivivens]|uniref:HTH luxR-type domain-containing protein n=1 Tax=Polaribacter aestuariivivens TaxID=2304626 RepID=A0A5S3NBZ0_9FLAO|nr:LuxR C-terminal-related transcriptional regulator [Polaribacter aestuariivivens]TMM31109.1 hypothetical protein FDT66_03835 [Polaribacter aestuariivivens]